MSDTASLFSDKSDIYARARPTYPDEIFHFIKDLCTEHKLAWDCATGNGQAAKGLANVFERVIATDISKEQIAHHLPLDNVEFSVCPAEVTPFADASFDLVNVAQALHWFDFERFWPEVKRVLKPGGVFITYAYGFFQINPEIDALVDRNIHRVIAPFWAKNNQLIMNAYRDVDFPFEKLPVPQMEIVVEWSFEQMMDYLHSWSATRRCMDKQGTDFFEHARGELQGVWGAPDTVRAVKMPMVIVAGRP